MPPIAVNTLDADEDDDVCHEESGTQSNIPLIEGV